MLVVIHRPEQNSMFWSIKLNQGKSIAQNTVYDLRFLHSVPGASSKPIKQAELETWAGH